MLSQSSTFPAEYSVTAQDAQHYSVICLGSAFLLLVVYGLVVAGFLPIAALALIVLLTFPRWLINIHELFHIYDEHQVNGFIRLMGVSPIPLSVISLSYDQIRFLHLGHHTAPGTETDPDAYHIRGSWMRAVVNAFTVPEQMVIRWIATYGLTRQLVLEQATKLLILGLLAWLGGTTFLWLWLFLRLVYGASDLAFFRLLHHHQGQYDTFALPLPTALITLSEIVFGKTVIQATIHHDIHHQYPYIAARSLASLR